MKGYYLDRHPDANVADQHFSVIYSPKQKRDRFPSTLVTLCESKEVAIAEQQPDKNFFAAEVIGPAKSSENLKIFYLVKWLEEKN
jgi:hypothetical protein